jgi:hypothetical protein
MTYIETRRVKFSFLFEPSGGIQPLLVGSHFEKVEWDYINLMCLELAKGKEGRFFNHFFSSVLSLDKNHFEGILMILKIKQQFVYLDLYLEG